MKGPFSFVSCALLLVLGFLGLPSPGLSQDYPSRPITFICSSEAGATTDITARALAAGAERFFGVPVVVENKGGGAHTVGAGLVASKKPDGYTLGGHFRRGDHRPSPFIDSFL